MDINPVFMQNKNNLILNTIQANINYKVKTVNL